MGALEAAIALVVLGCVVYLVLQARQTINAYEMNAETFYTGYVRSWVEMMEEYKARTGIWPGDGLAHGGTLAESDGLLDQMRFTDRGSIEQVHFLEALKREGRTPCAVVATSGIRGMVEVCDGVDVYSTQLNTKNCKVSETVYLGVAATALMADSFTDMKNVIYFENVPAHVARYVDEAMDGVADGMSGRVLITDIQRGDLLERSKGDWDLPTVSLPLSDLSGMNQRLMRSLYLQSYASYLDCERLRLVVVLETRPR